MAGLGGGLVTAAIDRPRDHVGLDDQGRGRGRPTR